MKRKRKSSPKKSHFHNAKKAKEANESVYNHSYAFIQSEKVEDWYRGKSLQALKAPNLF